MNLDLRAQRSAEILEAAFLEFAEKGFERAKMEEIARRAGIGKSTIYEYFPSKDELLVGVLREGMERLNQTIGELLLQPVPFRQTLIRLLGHTGRVLCESMLPFSKELRNCPSAVEFFQQHGKREMQLVLDLLEERVRRAIAQGEVRPDLDAHFAAGMAFSLIMAHSNGVHTSTQQQDQFAQRAVALLFEGIAPRPAQQ